MATKMILPGYSGYGTLAFGESVIKLYITSFSATYTKNIIKSQAPGGFLTKETPEGFSTTRNPESFQKTVSQYLTDWTAVDISMSFQATKSIMSSLFQMIKTNRNQVVKVVFKDSAYSGNITFNQCYLKTFSFDISQGSPVNVSLQLMAIQKTPKLTIGGTTLYAGNSDNKPSQNLIPYWDCQLTGKNDIVSINFSFSQDLTPKFGMRGLSDFSHCYKLLFGIPTISLTYSQLCASSRTTTFAEGQKSLLVETKQNITISCPTGTSLVCNDCLLQSVSPVLGDKTSGVLVEYTYSVCGNLT